MATHRLIITIVTESTTRIESVEGWADCSIQELLAAARHLEELADRNAVLPG